MACAQAQLGPLVWPSRIRTVIPHADTKVDKYPAICWSPLV